MLHNSLSSAAEENVLESCAPVRWHHDEVRRDSVPKPANFIVRRCTTEDIALRRRNAAFSCRLLELFERRSFYILIVCYEGRRCERRPWHHEVCRVVKLTNVGQMN